MSSSVSIDGVVLLNLHSVVVQDYTCNGRWNTECRISFGCVCVCVGGGGGGGGAFAVPPC